MDEFFFLGMPPPSRWGVIFNLFMLASPFVGLAVGVAVAGKEGGGLGLLIGMVISWIGLSWFFHME